MLSLPLKLHKLLNIYRTLNYKLGIEELLLITEFPYGLMRWSPKSMLGWIYREWTDVMFLVTHAGLNIHGMNEWKHHSHTLDNIRAIHQILSLTKLNLIFLPFGCRNIVPACFRTKYNNELILTMVRIQHEPEIKTAMITGHWNRAWEDCWISRGLHLLMVYVRESWAGVQAGFLLDSTP